MTARRGSILFVFVLISCSETPTEPGATQITGTWVGQWRQTACDTNFDARNCGRTTSGPITVVVNEFRGSATGVVVWASAGISVGGTFTDGTLRWQTPPFVTSGTRVLDWETRLVATREMRGRGRVDSRGMFGDREIFTMKEFEISRLRQVSRDTAE